MFRYEYILRIYGTTGWIATDSESEVLKSIVEALPGMMYMDVYIAGVWEEFTLAKKTNEDFPIRVGRANFRRKYIIKCAFSHSEIGELRNLILLLRSRYIFLWPITLPYSIAKPNHTVAVECVSYKTTHKGGIKIVEIEFIRRKIDG